MEIKIEIESIVAKLESRKEFVIKQLKKSPEGTLSYENNNNGGVLIQEKYVDGKRVRHKLNRDRDLSIDFIRKLMLEDELENLKKSTSVINRLINQIPDYNVDEEIKRLRQKYPCIDNALIQEAISANQFSKWQKQDYEMSNYLPEQRTQTTSFGLKVRSKSELLIAEKLFYYNVAFRYEQVLHIGDTVLIPDFTIVRADGKLFYWEHEGLTNVKKYLEWQNRKAQIYAAAGIVPWDNLIVTYDNPAGDIDLRMVESEIKNKLLI